jgi:hypothetical protein
LITATASFEPKPAQPEWPAPRWMPRGAAARCQPAIGERHKARWRSWASRSEDHFSTQKPTAADATRPVRQLVGSTPTGTRTPVPWLRTKYPRPLDDGGSGFKCIITAIGGVKRLANPMQRPGPHPAPLVVISRSSHVTKCYPVLLNSINLRLSPLTELSPGQGFPADVRKARSGAGNTSE